MALTLVQAYAKFYPGVDFNSFSRPTANSFSTLIKSGKLPPNARLFCSLISHGHLSDDGILDFHDLNPLISKTATLKPVSIDPNNMTQIAGAINACLIFPQLIRDGWVYFNSTTGGFNIDLSGDKALDHASINLGEPVQDVSNEVSNGELSFTLMTSVIVTDNLLLGACVPYAVALKIPQSDLNTVQGYTLNVSGSNSFSNAYATGFMITFAIAVGYAVIPTVPTSDISFAGDATETSTASYVDDASDYISSSGQVITDTSTGVGSSALTTIENTAESLGVSAGVSETKNLLNQALNPKPNTPTPPAVPAQAPIFSGTTIGILILLGLGFIAIND